MKTHMKRLLSVFIAVVLVVTSFTPVVYAKPLPNQQGPAYKIQYLAGKEDKGGFEAQLTIFNQTNKDMENWVFEFDYDEKIENPSGVLMSIKDYPAGKQYQSHYQMKGKGDTVTIPANGKLVIKYYVKAQYNGNINPQNYAFTYTLVEQKKPIQVESERASGMVILKWKVEEGIEYRVQKGTNTNNLVDISSDSIQAGLLMDEDLDTRQALLYRVKGYVNNKVVQESDIITFLSYIDSDGDGLSDEEEVRYGTDKTKSDTDTDGLSDYLEVHTYKTNPLKQDSDANGILDNKEDSDKDGLMNEQEIQFKTALDRMDSDSDGLDDKKEM